MPPSDRGVLGPDLRLVVGLPSTVSKNETVTGHDGVFLIRGEHVAAYVSAYSPQSLRQFAASAKKLDLAFMNFKVAKGLLCACADRANIPDHRFHPKRCQHGTTSSIQLLRRGDAGRAKRCHRARRSGRFATSVLDAACEYWAPPVIAGHGSKPDTRALLAVAGTRDSLVATSGNSSAGGHRQQPHRKAATQ
jgi:hypothetical protein